MERNFSLRCVLKYANGRTWRGMWDKSGPHPSDMAVTQPREGLVMAAIEAKDLVTREITQVASCKADIFDRFQWMAVASTPANFRGTSKLQGSIIGLTIQTRDERVTAYINGQAHIENIGV